MIGFTLDPSPIVFMVLYILVIIPYYVWLIKNKRKAYSNIEILERLAFVLYCIFLFKFSMMPIQFLKEDLSRYYYQIIPFKTISTMISDNNWQVQVLGNIAMLFPLPIFLGCFKNGKYKLLSAIKTT